MSEKVYLILNKSRFFDFITNHKKTIISALIILLAAIISIVWFGGDYLFVGTDLVFPPNGESIFMKTFSAWTPSSLGFVNTRMLAWSFPNGAFLGVSAFIGLSLESAEKLWFYFLFSFSGLSMYYLATTITKNKNRYAIGVIAALFYMFNPYLALGITNWPYLWLTYASLPLMIGLFIKGINEQKNLRYIILVSIILWITSSSQYVNPKYVILTWTPLFFYLIFYNLVNRTRIDFYRSMRFTVLLFCLWALVNSYWLLPNIAYFSQIITAPGDIYSAMGRTRLYDFTLSSAPLPDALRLLGSWIFNGEFSGLPYVYWSPIYSTALFVFIGYLIPIIASVPLIVKKEKHILFFSILFLASLLLMTGTYPPFGQLNLFLITHIPLALEVFNLPYVIFGIYAIIACAVLFGCGTILLSNYITEKRGLHIPQRLRSMTKSLFVIVIIILVIGVYAFPLWTGEVAYPGNTLLASSRYKIPDYYYQASAWLSSDPDDFRLFPLPYSIIGYVSYTWEPAGYQGPDLSESLFDRSVVNGMANGNLGSVIAQSIVSNSTTEEAKLLSLLNVKYIVFQNDVNWDLLKASSDPSVVSGSYIYSSPEKIKAILDSQDGFTFCKSFGQLDFYINNHWQPSKIYSASRSILSEGDLKEVIQIADMQNFTHINSVILRSSQISAQQLSAFPVNASLSSNQQNSVFLTYQEINPTKYIVHVNSSQPFFLVFSEAYDEGWAASLDDQQIHDPYHFIANGFANGWYVDKIGTYTMVLEFQPQKIFYIGVAVSLSSFLICIMYLQKQNIGILSTNLKKKILERGTKNRKTCRSS